MLASFWQDFLLFLSNKDDISSTVGFLRQLSPAEIQNDKIIINCPNQGVAFFLQKKAPLLEKYLTEHLNKQMGIDFVIKVRKRRVEEPLLKFEPSVEDVQRRAGLVGKHTFDNFAVSPTNQVAYAAAQAVSEAVGAAYNPLFLYGGVGVGKTHLAQAIAAKILEDDPKQKVLFCPGEQFTNEIVEAIRDRTTPSFRRKYRKLKLLIVDDVQFIGGKVHIQEEFFHTFNAIVSVGGQVVLTSDRQPQEIKGLEDRLISRFLGGLVVDIQQPDFELRTAILLLKAQEKNIEIDIETARSVAEHVEDTRALEGTLLSIYAKTLGGKEKVDLEAVEEFFSQQQKNGSNGRRRINPGEIIKAVCSFYDINQSQLKSPLRSERVALPRQVAMYLLRNELGLKLEEVAFLLKRRDHTTIIHGVDKISGLRARNPVFKEEVNNIIKSLSLST